MDEIQFLIFLTLIPFVFSLQNLPLLQGREDFYFFSFCKAYAFHFTFKSMGSITT